MDKYKEVVFLFIFFVVLFFFFFVLLLSLLSLLTAHSRDDKERKGQRRNKTQYLRENRPDCNDYVNIECIWRKAR